MQILYTVVVDLWKFKYCNYFKKVIFIQNHRTIQTVLTNGNGSNLDILFGLSLLLGVLRTVDKKNCINESAKWHEQLLVEKKN